MIELFYLLFIGGLIFGLALYEWFGIKSTGVFVIPLLAIYTLINYKVLIIALISVGITYIIGYLLQESFLFYGRRLYLVMAIYSFAITALMMAYIAGTEVIFASIIPSIIAYGLLTNGRDMKELVAYSAGFLFLLIMVGFLLLTKIGFTAFNITALSLVMPAMAMEFGVTCE